MEGCGEKWAEMDRVVFFYYYYCYSVPAFEYYQREQEAAGPLLPPLGGVMANRWPARSGLSQMKKTQHADMINLKERQTPREVPEGFQSRSTRSLVEIGTWPAVSSDTTNPSAKRPRVSSDCTAWRLLQTQSSY